MRKIQAATSRFAFSSYHFTPLTTTDHCPLSAEPVHGNTGKIDNCVMTVHLTYTSFNSRFRTTIDSALYLPRSWQADRARCCAARIPDDEVYRPKYEIALEKLDRATAEGVRFAWITADEWYSQKPKFAQGLEGHVAHQPHAP